METEVYYGEYYQVETTAGTEIVPVDVSGRVSVIGELRMYLEGKPLPGEGISLGVRAGYLARLTMPGYLDCTQWGAYDSEEEALADLDDMYGIDDNDA